ncbi:MAG: fixH [Hyphomicrobiales bacterium]|jgi:nitrogen fixation protein FixH|nr:fixH [Hyphomicrobiales bacterium]
MTTTPARNFILTGKHVLGFLFLFFGTVFSVNFYMASAAIRTFSGLEAEKPYLEGLRYDDEIHRAREQGKRGWKVDASVRAKEDGAIVEVTQKDSSGLVTPGLTVTASFTHPADRRRDVKIALAKVDAGRYQGVAPVGLGQWDVTIEASDDKALLFRSVSRIDLEPVK